MKKAVKILAFMTNAGIVCTMASCGYASEAGNRARAACRDLYVGPDKHKTDICFELAILRLSLKLLSLVAASAHRRERAPMVTASPT